MKGRYYVTASTGWRVTELHGFKELEAWCRLWQLGGLSVRHWSIRDRRGVEVRRFYKGSSLTENKENTK